MEACGAGKSRVPPIPPAQIAPQLLSVRGLTVRYFSEGASFNAISDVSFDIAPGQIVAVLGESGCGKTTTALSLLKLLPDTATITSGTALLSGRDIFSLSDKELRTLRGAQVAVVYQDSSVLNPVMRAGDQIAEVLRAHYSFTAKETRNEVLAILSNLGFEDCERVYHAYPHQLSGGQQQRIALAQALICKPKLLIADEPTASLDPSTASQILDSLKKLKDSLGTSILLISHDPALIADVADRILVMYSGRVVEQGSRDEIFANPLHPYTKALLQCARLSIGEGQSQPRRLPFIPGYAPDPTQALAGCHFASRCAERKDLCDSRAPLQVEALPGRLVQCLNYEVVVSE